VDKLNGRRMNLTEASKFLSSIKAFPVIYTAPPGDRRYLCNESENDGSWNLLLRAGGLGTGSKAEGYAPIRKCVPSEMTT